ncbi:hypothetical protein BC829DRAFT_41358 [Chytridium lagenaria]|nr:hypothetical protein BC829DRAFT_41358 [Chytridium lagenaria]
MAASNRPQAKAQETSKEDFKSDASKTKDVQEVNGLLRTSYDCAICFGTVFPKGLEKISPQIIRRTYMVTPCQHLFHTACLEKWMEVKFEVIIYSNVTRL